VTDVIIRFNNQDAPTIKDAFTGPGFNSGEFALDQLDRELKAALETVKGCIYYEMQTRVSEADAIYVYVDDDYNVTDASTLSAVIAVHIPAQPGASFTAVVVGSKSNPSTGSTSFVLMPEMTITGTFTGGIARIDFRGVFQLSSTLLGSDGAEVTLYVDGAEVDSSYRARCQISGVTLNQITTADIHAEIPVNGGEHTIEARWRRTGSQSSVTAYQNQRSLRVSEAPV
jgi:hypothetical protein